VAERSFGGYSYQQRLGPGVFGEVYRALSGTGQEARVIHVDPHLASRPAFARALVRFSEQTVPLEHARVIGMRQVGRSGDHVVVVTDAVSGPVALRDLAGRTGGRLPPDIALAIGLGAIEGLARAHSLGIVHGAVHPRSVLIDFHGLVKLADFGLGWALVETAVEGDEAGLLHALRGFLAPELASGQRATALGDVYAAGALLFDLMSGEPPPGELRAPPHVAQVIARALSLDPGARFTSASEMEERLEQAIRADDCPVAPQEAVARHVAERLAATDDALHAATDDLVAGLPPAFPEPGGVGEVGRSGRVTDLLAALEAEEGAEADEAPGDMTEVDPHGRGPAEPDLSDVLHLGQADAAGERLDGPGARHPTETRPARPGAFAVAAGEEDSESTPLPTPVPHRPGSVTTHLGELEAEDRLLRRRRRARDPFAASGDQPAFAARMVHRPRALLWVALTAFAVAGMGAVLYTQSDRFDPGRRADEERADEEARQAALASHERAQPRPADITVTAAEPEAAVWLLLGRTPLESMPLSAAMVHELRLEHEGYRPLDLRITGYQWKGEGEALRAEVEAELEQGTPRGPAPAYPAGSGAGGAPAGPRGRGVVHVRSRPTGAQVWLLIGFTPRATITGLEAGRDYELKVLKDGFRPGFAAVRSDEWYLSGVDGPVLTSLSREVSLTPAERRQGKPRRRGRKSQAGARD
jgi:hypothetical protein